MDFFVNPEIVWVEFTGEFEGWKVALKKEMDAGDQDVLEDTMLGVEIETGKDGKENPKPILRQGGLKILELNILRIVTPEGNEIFLTPQKIRQLSRAIRAKLLARIRELNRPLAELEKA